MRIGILCHPTYGGSGVVASELALSLAENDHRVHLFSHDMPPRLARAPGPPSRCTSRRAAPTRCSTPRPMTSRSCRGSWTSTAARASTSSTRTTPLPHAVSALQVRSAAAEAKLGPLKVVTTLHGTDITLVGNDPSYAPLTRYAIAASDAVTTVSEDLKLRTADNFEGVPPLRHRGDPQLRGTSTSSAPGRCAPSGPPRCT